MTEYSASSPMLAMPSHFHIKIIVFEVQDINVYLRTGNLMRPSPGLVESNPTPFVRALQGFPFIPDMTTPHPSEAVLPTLNKLEATVPDDLDVKAIAVEWFTAFASRAEAGDVDGVLSLMITDSYWRDVLAFTWDFRTFVGAALIKPFLENRLASTHPTALKLKDGYLALKKPFPDLAWIQGLFDFETEIGIGSGVFRLVPQPDGRWRAHCIFTNLDDLKGFPEKIGPLRNPAPNHGKWAQDRLREVEFADKDPTVLIVGAGHSGLEVAARLRSLEISSLIIEKNAKIGDNWRNRYDALCLHDPVYYDQMPYLPFPPTWPVYTPALKLANWLDSYATSMELNVWTSSTVTKASQDASNTWHVTVKKSDGKERVFHVKHIIFAMGYGAGDQNMPSYRGMDNFKGQILHSFQHKRASDHAGKKVVVIGSGTSAHDICAEYGEHGIDVTMFQRSSTYVISTKGMGLAMAELYGEKSPPTEISDLIGSSFPNHFSVGTGYRFTKLVAQLVDKNTLDGLREKGFKTNFGIEDTGIARLYRVRCGGYYIDVGASQMIIDGKIKVKSDSQIEKFTETGLKFENGSELPADVVVFSTGLRSDARDGLRKICGDEIANRCKEIWGLDEEGEIKGCWRDMGPPGLWYMLGNFSFSRIHSKHLALQIKAMEEGVFGTRYQ